MGINLKRVIVTCTNGDTPNNVTQYTAIIIVGSTALMEGPAADSVEDALQELLDMTGERLNDRFTANGVTASLKATAEKERALDTASTTLRSVYHALKYGMSARGPPDMDVLAITRICGIPTDQCLQALDELESLGFVRKSDEMFSEKKWTAVIV